MAKQYIIKWTKSDYNKLSWAVRKFNETKRKIETEENKLALPESFDYQELKSRILTREELNRTIKMLNRFSNENEQRLVKTEMGEAITNWELKELKKEKKRAERDLGNRLIEIQEENAVKRLGFKNQEQIEIEETLKSLNKLFTTKGADFRDIKERIHRRGNMNYEMWRNEVFRRNYYRALKDCKNYKNYKILKQKLDSIKNPNDFYKYVQSNDILADLFLRYGNKGLQYGAFTSDEEAFDEALKQLKLIEE